MKKPLAEWRWEKGLTQAQVALLARVSRVTVCDAENGRRRPMGLTRVALAHALGLSLDEIDWEAPFATEAITV